MIKEFWQEQRREKLKQKQLKKENKKQKLSGEEKAYKIFGVCFALFLVIALIVQLSSGAGESNYSWDSLVGISEEVKAELKKDVSESDILIDSKLSSADWSACCETFSDSGLNIIKNGVFDEELLSTTSGVEELMQFGSRELGALAVQMLEDVGGYDYISLLNVVLSSENNETRITSVIRLDLEGLISNSNLPNIYLTTTSRLRVLDRQLSALNSEIQVNNFSEELNTEVLEILNKNILSNIENYSNKLIVSQVNLFAELIHSDISVNGDVVEFN